MAPKAMPESVLTLASLKQGRNYKSEFAYVSSATLLNDTTQMVLVPKVYLMAHSGEVIASAADGSVSVKATAGDLNAVGGRFTDGAVALVLLGSSAASTTNAVGSATGTYVNRVGGVDAASLSVDAGRDAVLTAAAIRTTGDTVIQTERDVTLGTVTQASNEALHWDADDHRTRRASADAGTLMQAGGRLALDAGRDVNARLPASRPMARWPSAM